MVWWCCTGGCCGSWLQDSEEDGLDDEGTGDEDEDEDAGNID